MTFFQLFSTVSVVKALSYGSWLLSLVFFLDGEETLLIAVILSIYEIKYSVLLTAFRSKYILDNKTYSLILRLIVLGFSLSILLYLNENFELFPIIIFGFSSFVWLAYSYFSPMLERTLGGQWIFIENLSSLLSSVTVLLMLIIASYIFDIQDVIFFIILRSPLQFLIAYFIGAKFYDCSSYHNRNATTTSLATELMTFFFVLLFIVFKVRALELLNELQNGSDKIRSVVILYDILSVFCAVLVRWLIVKRKIGKLNTMVLITTTGLLSISFIINFTLLQAEYYVFVITLLSLSLSYQNFLRDYALYQFVLIFSLLTSAVLLNLFLAPAMLLLQALLVVNNWLFNETSY